MKCIHDFGNGCEAHRNEYMKIYNKDECDDFDDGTCHSVSVESTNGEDEYKNGADVLTIKVVNIDDTIKNNNRILRVCKLIMKKN